MFASFPEAAKATIPAAQARELRQAAEHLPRYEHREFYSTALQTFVHDAVRETCPDAFDCVVNVIKERIAARPYCALIAGLEFDPQHRLLVALNRAFGKLVGLPYQKPRAQLVHYIQPRTDLYSVRGGREVERLHTDAVDWRIPVELVSLECVRPDPNGGGRSRILDIDAIRDEVETKLGAEALGLLETTPVPWQLHACWGGGVKWQTILSESRVCWRRYTINFALDVNGAKLSTEMLDLLDAFEEVITGSTRIIDFLLREGDFLFSDNLRTIHARTAVAGGNASDRLLIRSWINSSGTE
jgi:hypothetical protein